MSVSGAFEIKAAETISDTRLDIFVASHIESCSRNRAATLIRQGLIRISGSIKKPGYQVKPGDVVHGTIPPPEPLDIHPEAIDLSVIYEDSAIIVVNKPPGLVVHPAPGHAGGTLVNALLHHCPDLAGIGGKIRPGIVHRLDKDTSGVMIVAKHQSAHIHLAAQFKKRTTEKTYLALVAGAFTAATGKIHAPIGRHPTDRKKYSTVTRHPRSAETHWQVSHQYGDITLLKLKIYTGRTHQIRVHCASIGHPLIGDPVYGPRRLSQRVDRGLYQIVKQVKRQMLHASRLEVLHPETGKPMRFEAPIHEDMRMILERLQMESRFGKPTY